jgi:sRNA-binding carbon storage regulator CsrA
MNPFILNFTSYNTSYHKLCEKYRAGAGDWEGGSGVLSLQMRSGEYLTIGENVVVQVFKESGPQFRVSIKAPREVSIVRGKVLEREGEKRPEGLRTKKPKASPSDQLRSARYLQKVAKRQETRALEQKLCQDAVEGMNRLLDRLGDGPEREEFESLREQMEQIADTWERLGQGTGAEAETADAGEIGESA